MAYIIELQTFALIQCSKNRTQTKVATEKLYNLQNQPNFSNLLTKLIPCHVISNKNTFLILQWNSHIATNSLTLLRPKFNLAPSTVVLSTHQSMEMILNSRRSEQELLVSDCILVPATEEHRFKPIDNSPLLRQDVDGMWPEFRNEFDYAVSTPNDATVRAIVYRQLECFRGLLSVGIRI